MHRLALSMTVICVGTAGCATVDVANPVPAHDNMDAIVWLQTSTEYAAAAASIYSAATTAIQEIAETRSAQTSGMAIVMDIDETVLDNSRYQAQLVFDGTTYDRETWDDWIALQAAPAVPGAVAFIRAGQSLGFHFAFITNRACRARPKTAEECPQKGETMANLKAVDIDTSSVTLFLRGERPGTRCRALLSEPEQASGTWSSDKGSRRACVGLEREVVMLFGDQLGDFISEDDGSARESGRDAATEYNDRWGKSWFMLPNPTYGNWKPPAYSQKQTQIRGIR